MEACATDRYSLRQRFGLLTQIRSLLETDVVALTAILLQINTSAGEPSTYGVPMSGFGDSLDELTG